MTRTHASPLAARGGVPVRAVALAVLAAWAVLLSLAMRGSLVGDEAFYAGVALESQRTGNSFPLVVNGVPYVEKPPLPIWLMGASLAALEPSPFAARLPSLLCGMLAVALVAGAATLRLGATAGSVAALLLVVLPTANGLNGNHGLGSGTADAGMLLALLITIGSVELWSTTRKRRDLVVALAAAFLTAWFKGAAGPAFLTLALLCWSGTAPSADTESARKRSRWPMSVATMASGWMGFGAWILSLHLAGVPRLLERVFLKGIARRLTEGLDATHRQGPGFYAEILWRDFGPGLLVLAAGLLVAFAKPCVNELDRLRRAAGLTWLVWLAVLSIPASKLPWYLLPVYPMGILVAVVTLHELTRRRAPRSRRALGFFAGALLLSWPAATTLSRLSDPPPLHTLDAALHQLEARGIQSIEVDPALGFGRRRELDATEYYLAEMLRRRGDRGLSVQDDAKCAGFLTAVPGGTEQPVVTAEERIWAGVAQQHGGRAVLLVRCSGGGRSSESPGDSVF